MRFSLAFASAVVGVTAFSSLASAQEFKIGASVALSGYLASIDRAWKDGAVLAAQALNDQGKVLGHSFGIVAEDMRSEPVDAVTAVKKMIASDRVGALVNGCSSAGNSAVAPLVERAQIPMILCSILPPKPEDQKWAFSLLPSPAFEVEPRLARLQSQETVKKIAILHDPTPYARFQRAAAEELAPKYGVEIVATEQYQLADADMTAYFTKVTSAGAQAVLKLGVGPTTITAAKAVRQLGLSVPLFAGTDELTVLKGAAEVLGDQFLFLAQRIQILDLLPEDASTKSAERFRKLWSAQHGDRDPTWGSRGWDAVHLIAEAARKVDSRDGAKLRATLENTSGYQGASGELSFSASDHKGVTKNPYHVAQIVNGKIRLVR